MEDSKQESENPPSPPSKKLKLDSTKNVSECQTNAPAFAKPSNGNEKEVFENSESKKHPADNLNDPVPFKKLKQNDIPTISNTDAVKDSIVEKQPDIKESEEDTIQSDEKSSDSVVLAKTEVEKAAPKPEPAVSKESKSEVEPHQTEPQTEEKITEKGISSVSDAKAIVSATESVASKSPEARAPEAKPEANPSLTKILKKLPGLNPIRPMSAPLQVNTDMASSTRATISPVPPGRKPTSPHTRPQVSPGARPQLSPGNVKSQLPSSNVRSQIPSPKQMVGAAASITPVRNKSPIAHLQRTGSLTISQVKQKSQSVSISPVHRGREVSISPFRSREVTLSALTQQGLSITPAQPRLSAEIRSQIPEGISITAVSSSSKSPLSAQLKAKSPLGQPRAQKTSPPKAFGQQLRPQGPQIRKPTPARPQPRNALPEPGMLGRLVRTPSRQPGPRLPQNKPSPIPGEHLKHLLSQKPKETSLPKPPPAVQKAEPDSDQTQPKLDVPHVSEKAKQDVVEPKPTITEPKTKTPETAVKSSEKSIEGEKPNEDEKMDISTEDDKKETLDEQKAKKKEEIEKKLEAEPEKEEEDSESSSEDETDQESGEDNDSKDSKPPKGRGKKSTPSSTPSRALRTRKTIIETNVAVKLTRIDDELEDGALPPWNLKKLNKSTVNSEAESGDASDDNSNSQGSKMSSTLGQGETGGPKKRGRPRKTVSCGNTLSPICNIEDYTTHESLHEVLKKIIADEGLEAADSDDEDEEDKDEEEGRRETKMLLATIPFFSRRGGRGGMKGKAIGKNNQFDNSIVDKLEHDRRFRNEMLQLYQDDLKKREERKVEKLAEIEKKRDEKNKAAQERKEKLKQRAEERRRKYEEQKKAKIEEAKKREEARKLRASLNAVQNFDDDTRMSFPPTPGTPGWKNTGVKFESLEDGEKSESKGKRAKMETIDFDSQKEFPVQGLAEYQWPLQGGEHFMIQEQVAAYLGVKSFKRKYPDLKRRGLEPEERTYICDSGLVSEAMIELGLTAVQSADIMDIMFVDFPEKYEEVKKFSREKQARELIDRQRAFYDTTISEQTSKDLKESLVEATAQWNAQFNRLRRETRQCALDLQTFVVHYPAKANRKPAPKMGHYPVPILPGQYCDYYKEYTSTELKYMPLNTVLYGPLLPNEPYPDELSYSDQTDSGGESDSDTSSSGSSSDSSSSSEDSSSEDEDAPKPLPPTPGPKKQTPQGNKTNSTPGHRASDGHKASDSRLDGDVSTPVVEQNGADVDEPMEVETSKEDASTPRNCKACDRDQSAGEMIRCGKCVRFLHPGCLDLPLDMLPHMRLYEWQCSDCKSCVSCQLAQDDDKMLFCDLCDRGYHNYCIGLDKIPTGRWHCKVCSVCSVCKTTEPNTEWEHEMKKGPKGQSVYQRTLCTPCAKSSADTNSRSQRR